MDFPVGHILVLVPRFDREFFRDTARSGAEMAPDLK